MRISILVEIKPAGWLRIAPLEISICPVAEKVEPSFHYFRLGTLIEQIMLGIRGLEGLRERD